MRAESTKGRLSALGILGDRDAPAVLADALVFHVAADQREERVVATDADAGAGHDPGPALADDDRAGVDELSAVCLHAEHLGVRVTTVSRRASALLVGHRLLGLLLDAPS